MVKVSKSRVWGAAACLVGLIALFIALVMGGVWEAPTPPAPEAVSNPQKSPRSTAGITRREYLEARTTPDFLARHLESAIERNLIRDDAEIRRVYAWNLSKFPPETLALLTVAEVGLSTRIMKLVASSAELDFVRDYHVSLGDHGDKKSRLMHFLGSESPILAPDRISSFVDGMPELTKAEAKQLGRGIVSRLKFLSGDEDAKIEELNLYYSNLDDFKVLSDLSAAAVRLMETNEAIEWLKEGESAMMASGDKQFVRSLTPENYEKGFDLINFFVETDQVPRARSAIEQFLFSHASRDPVNIFTWVNNLDDSVKTNQMLATSFRALYGHDPETAISHLEETSDPALKTLYQDCVIAAKGTNPAPTGDAQ